jgi:hypothetical protein
MEASLKAITTQPEVFAMPTRVDAIYKPLFSTKHSGAT